MRSVFFTVALLAAPARAESPPLVIQPFTNRCFDAARLAERVRAQLPELDVAVGAARKGAHQLVRVTADESVITIHLTVVSERHRVVGREERQLPAGDCAGLAETAALIVARAATPMAFRSPPAPRRHSPDHRTPEAPRPPDNRTAEKPPEPQPSEPPAPPQKPPDETPPPPRPPEKPPSENRTVEAPKPTPPAAVPPVVTLVTPSVTPPPHHRLEIDVAAQWAFPLDGDPSTPAGELTLGWRWRRGGRFHLGLGARAGVSGEWSESSRTASGMVTVTARRIPVSLELRFDIDVAKARGVIRLSVGPQAAVWVARSTGLPRPATTVFAEPGAFVRVAYRLELGRAVLTTGLDLDAAFIRDDLKVGGVGRVSRTPVVQLLPFVGAGVAFL